MWVIHLPNGDWGVTNSILVVVDRLYKMAHFIPSQTIMDAFHIAKLLFFDKFFNQKVTLPNFTSKRLFACMVYQNQLLLIGTKSL
jgi:hypothetical protein